MLVCHAQLVAVAAFSVNVSEVKISYLYEGDIYMRRPVLRETHFICLTTKTVHMLVLLRFGVFYCRDGCFFDSVK